MSQNDFMKFFDTDITKNLAEFGGFPFDVSVIIESQRRNLEAFSEAQQRAFESMKEIAQRQGEIIAQMAGDNAALAQEIMTEGTPEQKVAKQADIIKSSYEKSLRHMSELGDMITKTNKQASDIINKRVTASLNEIKSAMEKKTTKSAPMKKAA